MNAPKTTRIVTIPGCAEHEGYICRTVALPWVCLKCGRPRGEPFPTLSYDGSRRLACHGWRNPCGHVETYAEVRATLSNPPETTMKITRRSSGFTLIELMIVIAIIGILASIAIPAYMNYTTRAQVTEGLSLASGIKVSMSESYAANGRWPSTAAAAGLDGVPEGGYVEAVDVTAGVILVTYGRRANESITTMVLALAPGVDPAGDVLWTCGYHPSANPNVEWQGDAAALTTVPAKFLPSSCRNDD